MSDIGSRLFEFNTARQPSETVRVCRLVAESFLRRGRRQGRKIRALACMCLRQADRLVADHDLRNALCITALLLSSSPPAQARSPAQASTATIAPPSAPATQVAPSLDETEKFIAEKVSEQGHISSIIKARYNIPNNQVVTDTVLSDGRDNIVFSECNMHLFHDNYFQDHDKKFNRDMELSIKSISEIRISTDHDDAIKLIRRDALRDRAISDIAVVSPSEPLTYKVNLVDGLDDNGDPQETSLYFRQNDTASRVARAFAHAVFLCGGAKKEPF